MKPLRSFRLFTAVILLLSLLLPFSASAERVYLDITTDKTRQIMVAVPAFASSSRMNGAKYANLLARALQFHGIISIIAPERYGNTQQTNWQQVGADFAVLGKTQTSGNSLNFQIRVLDVASGSEILGKSITGNIEDSKKMLFNFCDTLIENLTGSKGIANTHIAFVGLKNNAKEIYLTDILGKELRQVTRHKNITVSPRFVPKSSKLSYSSFHTGSQKLYITDLRQNRTTRVLSRRKGMNVAPAWSPGGDKMILTLSYKGNPDLFMLDSKGKMIKQITKNAGINVSPAWSPDGRYIVFVSDRSGRPQLYRMEIASQQTERITYEGRENIEPTWSPTENLITYTSLRNGVYQICTMNPLQPGNSNQLTSGLSASESPAWSPDGKQIIFSKRGGKQNQIYAIMKNGSFKRKLFSFPGSQTYPRWVRNTSF